MNTWFANLSVTRKLALGFGLVLALTLALAWTAWSGLGSVIQRSTWMSEITQLNATLTNLRIARLQFMLAKGDAASTERLLTNLNLYLEQQSCWGPSPIRSTSSCCRSRTATTRITSAHWRVCVLPTRPPSRHVAR